MHRTTNRFWKRFERLPESVQKVSKHNWVWIGTHDEYERMIKEMGEQGAAADCRLQSGTAELWRQMLKSDIVPLGSPDPNARSSGVF